MSSTFKQPLENKTPTSRYIGLKKLQDRTRSLNDEPQALAPVLRSLSPVKCFVMSDVLNYVDSTRKTRQKRTPKTIKSLWEEVSSNMNHVIRPSEMRNERTCDKTHKKVLCKPGFLTPIKTAMSRKIKTGLTSRLLETETTEILLNCILSPGNGINSI